MGFQMPQPRIYYNRRSICVIADLLRHRFAIDREYHANITILRTTWSGDGNSVTIFLTDSTYELDASGVGYVAICNKVAGEEFWLAVVYHEWFIIEPDPVFEVSRSESQSVIN